MFRRILALSSAAGLALAGMSPAVAGDLSEPVVEPPVVQPAPVAPRAMVRDWTGFYGGLQFGYGDLSGGISGDGMIAGGHLGYLYDFGRFAVGAEARYDIANMDAGAGVRLREMGTLSLRAGPTLDRVFVYGTVGYANARVETLGRDDGWTAGIGMDYALDDSWTVGAEVTRSTFDSFNGGPNIRATTLQARTSFRF